MVFLAGPPGAGKSSLGSRACQELGLRFLDLGATSLASAIDQHLADVIELPWSIQQDGDALALARRSGTPLLLWAHPDNMQARSGHSEPLFTPVARLKGGGFGRNGTSCREFRRLDRACGTRLLLVGLSFEEAAEVVRDAVADLRAEATLPPVEREGLSGWVRDWVQDVGANREASEIIADAMARYIIQLRSRGVSPRTLAGITSDLNAAGWLVMMYDAPKGRKVLGCFDGAPQAVEYRFKFSDSPNAQARYRRSLEGFARFLEAEASGPRK